MVLGFPPPLKNRSNAVRLTRLLRIVFRTIRSRLVRLLPGRVPSVVLVALLASAVHAGRALAAPDDPVSIPDATLRTCLETVLKKPAGATITEADMASVTVLLCGGYGVASLEGLQYATALSQAGFASNVISDLAPLAGLTSLTSLELSNNNSIADISALAGLTSLTYLGLGENLIADISALAGLAALETLYLHFNQISDVSPLAELTSIAYLDFSYNDVYDISALTTNSAIGADTTIDMVDNPLGCAALSDAAALRTRGATVYFGDWPGLVPPPAPTGLALALAGNTATLTWSGSSESAEQAHVYELRHGSPAELSGWMMVPGGGVAREVSVTVPGLSGNGYFFEVRGVNAAGCGAVARVSTGTTPSGGPVGIPDAALRRCIEEALGKHAGAAISQGEMATLTYLACVGNGVASLEGLQHATALAEAHLGVNAISDLSPLAELTSLTTLTVGGNDIADISPLAGLTSLTHLSIADNYIADISALAGLTAIEVLAMEVNLISDVSALAGLTSIRLLHLTRNNVYDISALTRNRGIGPDTRVEMWENPLGCAAVSDAVVLRARGATVVGGSLAEVPPPAPTDLSLAVAGDIATLTWGRSTDHRERAHVYELRHGRPAALGGWMMVPSSGCRGGWCVGAREATVLVPRLGDDEYVFEVRGVNFAGCGAVARASIGTPSSVLIPDAALRRCVEEALGKPAGAAISHAEMATLLGLTCRNAGVADLSGLETATALVQLDLFGNLVADLAPLGELAELAELALHGNRVSDVGPLAEIAALERLWLNDNAIADIAPLADNDGLGAGEVRPDGSSDYVDLRGNALDATALDTYVPALRERGAAVLVDGTHLVPVFLPGGSLFGESFARVINRSAQAGEVRIEAIDATGQRYGPVTLAIGARQTAHFTATDLELGNAAKGLAAGVGYGDGDWRLELRSALDLAVSAYLRARDVGHGLVSGMSAVAPETYAQHHMMTFDPGSGPGRASKLRLLNPGAKVARALIEGIDDSGETASVAVTVPAGGSRDFTAAALAAGDGDGVVAGRLGDGVGKWRFTATSYDGVHVLSLLESTMQLTNLSSSAPAGSPHHLPLFRAASPAREGYLRIVNLSQGPGSVELRAFDQNGRPAAPVSWALRPGGTEISWRDLASGSSARGLPNGIGEGNWRLELHTSLDIRALSYFHTGDAVYGLHPFAPRTDDGASHVGIFNPASNRNIAGLLRLVNVGDAVAQVEITGIDDRGESTGGLVRTAVPAGATREFTATQLESGNAEALSGALGDGEGKWQLQIATDGDLRVLSLLAIPEGFLTNVSR